ncbi:TetR/AcrR family transcriptional regulator [Rubrobacter xylanophilus]|uniref:TetR/AcrR family transcriptional regulator n=1 Tax=Rubrobacter xylanophilus TaxID=49319 RepID=UPI0000460C56|nr:TetR/AcrR family transcriptional regulator [Rubrobacter xylanophilus]
MAGGGRREDPRVRRTRELILRAFAELIEEKGHAGLTVQEIAERATINRATFYAHFRDQYELFDHYVSEAFRKELRRRLPGSPGLSEESLRALVLAACEYLAGLETTCRRKDRRFRPLIEARVQRELYELLLGWMEGSPWAAGGRSAAREVTASVVSWAIFGAALDWSRGGTGCSPAEVADHVLSAVVEGLRL